MMNALSFYMADISIMHKIIIDDNLFQLEGKYRAPELMRGAMSESSIVYRYDAVGSASSTAKAVAIFA